ncbi:MAG: M48 family metallopeptidase [Alphaproteobacteria bacterium]|nr:M48 family metallopeptidase [Alphaproteobacteria bacterium]
MALVATGLTTHIYNNHLKSFALLAGFPLLLVLMVGAFCTGLDAMMQNSVRRGSSIDWHKAFTSGQEGIVEFGPYAVGAALIWFVIAYFFHEKMMRAASGAVPVTRREMPKIYNLLENLCISRGLPMPQFEVIDSPALNAFATGLNEKTYKIVLTRGIIDRLSDDELEAVIAHELTHIINRDVRLLIIAVVFTGIISFLAEMVFRSLVHGRRPNYYRRRRSNNNNGGVAVMLLALAVLVVGWLFALAIRFTLSRKREYLADAGAVELTHNPEAMMRALQRISGQDKVTGMPDDVQQMCIENSHSFMGLFATHPPIDRRIITISKMTGTPVPQPQVSLRRGPRSPWDQGPPPATQETIK